MSVTADHVYNHVLAIVSSDPAHECRGEENLCTMSAIGLVGNKVHDCCKETAEVVENCTVNPTPIVEDMDIELPTDTRTET